MYGTKSLDLEENAQEATRKERGKNAERTRKATQISTQISKHPYQNQNIICLSLKNIVPLLAIMKKNEKKSCCRAVFSI